MKWRDQFVASEKMNIDLDIDIDERIQIMNLTLRVKLWISECEIVHSDKKEWWQNSLTFCFRFLFHSLHSEPMKFLSLRYTYTPSSWAPCMKILSKISWRSLRQSKLLFHRLRVWNHLSIFRHKRHGNNWWQGKKIWKTLTVIKRPWFSM